jgi:hypothetical protein
MCKSVGQTFYPVHQKGGLFDMINSLTHLASILPSTPERWFVLHDRRSYTFGEHSTQYTRKVVCLTWSTLFSVLWTMCVLNLIGTVASLFLHRFKTQYLIPTWSHLSGVLVRIFTKCVRALIMSNKPPFSLLLHIWQTFYPVHQKGGLLDMINTLTLSNKPPFWCTG